MGLPATGWDAVVKQACGTPLRFNLIPSRGMPGGTIALHGITTGLPPLRDGRLEALGQEREPPAFEAGECQLSRGIVSSPTVEYSVTHRGKSMPKLTLGVHTMFAWMTIGAHDRLRSVGVDVGAQFIAPWQIPGGRNSLRPYICHLVRPSG